MKNTAVGIVAIARKLSSGMLVILRTCCEQEMNSRSTTSMVLESPIHARLRPVEQTIHLQQGMFASPNLSSSV